jgi:hypothetical protein
MKYQYRHPLVDAKLFNGNAHCGEAIAKWANSFDGIKASFIPTQEPYDDGEVGCPFTPANVHAAGPNNSVTVTAGNYLIIFADGDLGQLRAAAFHKEYAPADNGRLVIPHDLIPEDKLEDFRASMRQAANAPIIITTNPTEPGEVADYLRERLPGDDPNPTQASLINHWPFPVHEPHRDCEVEPAAHVHHSELVDWLHGGPDEAPSAKPVELEGEDDA